MTECPEIWVSLEDGDVAEIYWGEEEPQPDSMRYLPAAALQEVVEELEDPSKGVRGAMFKVELSIAGRLRSLLDPVATQKGAE